MSQHRPLFAVWALGLLVHGLWALTVREPVDWDPAYYEAVARNIAQGRGAVTDAVWMLSALPDALPAVADTHWMPLPSRVLVPFLLLWPGGGAQLGTVLLAALWAPLALALARALGAEPRVALGAGLLCALGGGYSRFLSTPDSIALYGLLGAGGLLAVQRGRPGAAAAVAALAALCRGDGFLLGPCLALGLSGPAALGVAVAGPLAAAAWLLRSLALAGPLVWSARAAAAAAPTLEALVLGDPRVASLGERGLAWLHELPELLVLVGVVGVFLLPWPALAAAWAARREPAVRAAVAYALLMPTVTMLSAPGVAGSGTAFRSGAALFPLFTALAALGLAAAGRFTAARRGYPAWFVPALTGLGFAVGSVGLGLSLRAARPAPELDCGALDGLPAGAVVFAAEPLHVADLCGRPAVILPHDLDPAQVPALVARFRIAGALLAPARGMSTLGATVEDAPRLLPGWRAAGPQLYLPPGALPGPGQPAL
jgi:hypothetical protein